MPDIRQDNNKQIINIYQIVMLEYEKDWLYKIAKNI